MQRLTRINLEQQNIAAVELFHHYDDIMTILRHHLPPSTAANVCASRSKWEYRGMVF